MDAKRNRNQHTLFIGLALMPIIIMILCIGFYVKSSNTEEITKTNQEIEHKAPGEIVIREKNRENLVTTETRISCEIIEDGLKDMGFLVTETYYFTELLTEKKENLLFGNINLSFGQESYTVSYEGDVTAGIDFGKIEVTKDDEQKQIKVRLPESEIFRVYIDPNSFKLLDEKHSVFNKFTVSDFNEAQKGLAEKAEENAKSRKLLENAERNAENVIRSFIGGIVDTSEYKIVFEKQ